MSEKEDSSVNRRNFLKKAGTVSVAAAGFSLASVSQAGASDEEEVMEKYWQKRQKKFEALEEKAKKITRALILHQSMSTGARIQLTTSQPFMPR